MARIFLSLMMLLASAAHADDNGRVLFLESEVRNLKRDVQSLQRQLDELRSRPVRITPPSAEHSAVPATDLPPWVDAGKWRMIRPGMSELEVIGSLGAPTSMRDEGDARVLFYALEIGASGFLGGSVKLRDRAVAEVRQPTLQ